MAKKKQNTLTQINQPIENKAVEIPSKPLFNQNIIDYLILSAICLFMIFIRSKFLQIPMERDEGAYILFGKQFLEGKIPYIDFFDNRLPMLFYAYACVALFGTTLQSTALVFAGIEILTTIILFITYRNLLNRTVAWVGALAFVLLTLNSATSGFSRQSEHFVNLFMVVGIFFLFQKQKSKWQYFWAGIFLCLAMMTKHNAVFFVIYGGIFLVLTTISHQPFFSKYFFTRIGLYALGVLTTILILFGSIALMGATQEMWYWGFVHSGIYATQVAFNNDYFHTILSAITNNYEFFMYSSYLGLLSLWFSSKEKYLKISLWAFFLLSFLTVCPGNHFYPHYFLMWMPAVALFVGIFFDSLREQINKFASYSVSLLVLIPFVLGVFIHLNKQKEYYFSPNYTNILKEVYTTNNAFPEAIEIAKQIKPEIKTGDYLGILGSEQELFLYTNTQPASKHTFSYPLMLDSTISKNPIKWQKEYIAEVEKNKPKFIVFFRQATSFLSTPKSSKLLFQWTDKYLNDNYNLYGIADIYPNEATRYIWGKDVQTYPIKENDVVLIFRRK